MRQDALSVRRGQRLVGVLEREKAVKDARARVHAGKDDALDALHVPEARQRRCRVLFDELLAEFEAHVARVGGGCKGFAAEAPDEAVPGRRSTDDATVLQALHEEPAVVPKMDEDDVVGVLRDEVFPARVSNGIST